MDHSEVRQNCIDLCRNFKDSKIIITLTEAMDIVGKYQDKTQSEILDTLTPAEILADGQKLAALNMNIGMYAGYMNGKVSNRKAAAKLAGAKEYTDIKERLESSGAKVVAEHLKKSAELKRYTIEVQATEVEGYANIFKAATENITEIINMMKKLCDYLLSEST